MEVGSWKRKVCGSVKALSARLPSMDRIGRKVSVLKEKIKIAITSINGLRKENKKLVQTNEDLLSKVKVFEEENKMARKFTKERDIVKSRIRNILENIERANI